MTEKTHCLWGLTDEIIKTSKKHIKTHWPMKRKINCETARNFPVTEALEKLGHFPKRETEQDAWFLSPFRSETQASLKVSKRKNRWYDHGEGVGGNVIDLVSRVLKCSIEETLEFLDAGMAIRPIKQRPIFNKKETKIDIVKVRDIMHPALVEYLSLRYIPITVAKRYCKEVWYQYKDNRFFAIGLENIKGGWELRNKLFKNGSSPKSYTYLQYNKSQLIILEGMFDLLSLATLDGT
ncbi:CHC2 zinc finger domain-containing protein, partial [Yeosuana aromativorans]|uniref:CHC2 zinc finger domain-containing protein n=1 Tax=Yeosuana aromativorans TaxID=288019 RepID=UPI00188A1D00